MTASPSRPLPAPVRRVQLRTPRGPLAALEASPPGSASSTVLFVPGYTGSKEDFAAVLGPLADAGRRAVALDQRGQFESPRSEDAAAYEIATLAADVLAAARDLDHDHELDRDLDRGGVHLVGHSFGGLVARAAVLADPDAFRSLTLLCSGPAALPEPRSVRLRMLVDALAVLDLSTIWARMRELEQQDGLPARPQELEEFLERRFLANCPGGLRQMGQQLLAEPDRVAELTVLGDRLPLHVVYGEHDDAWAPAVQAQMARRLGARETVIPGAGHSPAAEAPAATAAALQAFWADVEGPSVTR